MLPLDGLGAIASRYDAILSDVWGVIHNGVAAHPTAVEALVNYRKQGGRVVLITNAPIRAPIVAGMLDKLGVPREAYDTTIQVWLDPNRNHLPVRATQKSGGNDEGYELRLLELTAPN